MATDLYKNFQTQPGVLTAVTLLTAPAASGSSSQVSSISGINKHATLAATLIVFVGGSAAANTLFSVTLNPGESFERVGIIVLEPSETLQATVSVITSVVINGSYLETTGP